MKYSLMTPEQKVAYRSRVKAYRKAHPEKVKNWTKSYRNTEKYREVARNHQRRRREKNPTHILDIALKSGRKKLPTPTRPCPTLCELCGNPSKRRVLHLDHDHKSKTFRGWLCHNCNLGLGRFGDNAQGLRRALAYLDKNSAPLIPHDAAARKQIPLSSGVLDYFPAALLEVAKVSYQGNQQHNPGQPLHWARGKSTDQDDTVLRHFLERGSVDVDGMRHSAKMCWRALAILQLELEAEGAPVARGAK